MSDHPVQSVKPTIPSERVPDFHGLANEFRADQDFAVWKNLSQRSDKALRRKLFLAARAFLDEAYRWRGEFKKACKPLGINGNNIEAMAIRFLFGPVLDKHAVHDWSCVIKYWRECELERQDVEAAAKRTITELKTAWREFKKSETDSTGQADTATEESKTEDKPSLWDVIAKAVTDVEPALVIEAPGRDEAVDQMVGVDLWRQYADGTREFYRAELSENGLRQIVSLVKSHLPTERAVLKRRPNIGGDWQEAAQ